MRPVTLLVVDDEPALRASLRRLLTPEGFQVLEAGDGRSGMALIARSVGLDTPYPLPPEAPQEVPHIDVVITDLRMPRADGMELLRFARHHAPHAEVIVLTAFAEVSDAVAALRLGAHNFLEKPFEPEALLVEVRRAQLLALERERERRDSNGTGGSSLDREPHGLIGQSPAMTELRALLERVGRADSTVLIQGESGTGKELVARALHESSPRGKGPFVAVHCGAIPENLIESELFGHVKGAYTGAASAREGRFALAEGGTIFLDEIGEMPLAMQVKLLRVLQEKTYEPVGGSKPRRGDFRVLAATHRDLRQACAAGTFRLDLFYRLNVVPVTVPPLRERADDLPLLCSHFLSAQNAERGTSVQMPETRAMQAMMRYGWPGNVRELEHLVERIVVLKGSGPITVADLPAPMQEAISSPLASVAPVSAAENRTLDLNAELMRLEVELIRRALFEAGGNKNRASQLLGLNRTTLIEKIKRMDLQHLVDEASGRTTNERTG